jgi:hypothetical protein
MDKKNIDLRCPKCNDILYGKGDADVVELARVKPVCICQHCGAGVFAVQDDSDDLLNQMLGGLYYYTTERPTDGPAAK